MKWPKGETRTLTHQEAKQVLKGWKCIDGEDRCPGCWGGYLQRVVQKSNLPLDVVKEDIQWHSSSVPLDHRRCREGRLVICEDCQRAVFVPDETG